MAARAGERIARALQRENAPPLGVQMLERGLLAATRVRCDVARTEALSRPMPREDAYLVSLHLRAGPVYDFWLRGRHIAVDALRRGCMSMVHLGLSPVADLRDPFDALVLNISRSALDAIADEHEVARIDALDCVPGKLLDDPVVAHLGHSLLPALELPSCASRLFLEHVGSALHLHLARRYGRLATRPRARVGRLALWQERRTKDLLLSRLDGDIPLEELARQVGLSRSHFVRAFRQTTGQPPHRWQLAQRIQMASEMLLRPTLSIAEIARRLGFADQSHLTRAFRSAVGVPPGVWRRQRLA